MSAGTEAWRALRALRSRPPGAGGLPGRHATFSAALEQSEQLFTAARAVGYEARPLPLFYALSQAGRAIAAALEVDDARWKLSKHGIGSSLLDGPLWAVTVTDQRAGSFVRVAEILGSPTLPTPTRLGDLLVSLPEVAWLAPHAGDRPALRVGYAPLMGQESFGGPTVNATSVAITTAWLYGIDPDVWRTATDQRVAVGRFLDAYPQTAGYTVPGQGGGDGVYFHPHPDGSTGVRVQWTADGMNEFARELRIRQMTIAHRPEDDMWIVPVVAGQTRPLHPLIAWWAVTFALSMMARYQPDGWVNVLDVDDSIDATVLETLLDRALDTVPQLIHSVLTTPTARP